MKSSLMNVKINVLLEILSRLVYLQQYIRWEIDRKIRKFRQNCEQSRLFARNKIIKEENAEYKLLYVKKINYSVNSLSMRVLLESTYVYHSTVYYFHPYINEYDHVHIQKPSICLKCYSINQVITKKYTRIQLLLKIVETKISSRRNIFFLLKINSYILFDTSFTNEIIKILEGTQ